MCEKWARDRNRVAKTRQVLYYRIPVDLTGEPVTVDKLDYWMSFFVMEARRQDGACYPPNSLFNIVTGVRNICVMYLSCVLSKVVAV